MTAAPIAIAKALEQVMREDRGRLTAALIGRLRNFHLAEEALQEATLSALSHWGRAGLPASPQGWLLKVAFRKALDKLRRGSAENRKAADLALLAGEEADEREPDMIVDDRLRLIFTCCHPALEQKSRVALTLRTLGGLTTPQIAQAFLDTDSTMGQRLSRAKTKIATAGIPFAVPGPEDWPDRLNSVLTVIYLIYTAGYTTGPVAGRDLCEEAIYLGRMLATLAPGRAEVEGCLALMLLTSARAPARTGTDGATMPPALQDRNLWHQDLHAQGEVILNAAAQRNEPGPFQLKAAISLAQMQRPVPWPGVLALHDALAQFEDTPITRLNRAVAVLECHGPVAALRALDPLARALDGFQPYHAARAEVLARAEDSTAQAEYDRALALTTAEPDRRFLLARQAAAVKKKAELPLGQVQQGG